MKTETYKIWDEEEYKYPAAYGFRPNIHTYLHEDKEKRPGIVVIPGGGYRIASPTEGEIVAKRFYDAGFQAFVFTYTTNLMNLATLGEQPLRDLSRAVRFVRKKAQEFALQEDKLFVCGFSAGAHLAGSLAVHWPDVQEQNPYYKEVSNRPTGAILSYPVITSGKYAHRDSFVALCGADASEEELAYWSLEKQVSEDTCPTFLWQTVTDETVPVENSLLMAEALKKVGVPFELHLFPEGMHGLSLSNELWETGDLGEPYPMEQIKRMLDAVKSGEIVLSEEEKRDYFERFGYLSPEENADGKPRTPSGVAVKQVAVWPELAVAWMREF